MGILKDLKNIFFGASSVTKHAAEKATDFVKEEGAEFLDKGKDILSDSAEVIADKTSGLRDSILDGGSDMISKSKDKLMDITDGLSDNPLVDKAKDISENIGEKVLSTGESLTQKVGEMTEGIGAKVMDTGGEMLEKGKSLSEDVGEKVLDVKDKLMDKAKDVKEDLSVKLNETMDKADAWVEAEKAKPKKEFADDTIDASGSLLEGKDDFFSKADKFASGEYDAFSEGKITIEEPIKDVKNTFENSKPATGFTDLDGDGNEIIDDAILDSDIE